MKEVKKRDADTRAKKATDLAMASTVKAAADLANDEETLLVQIKGIVQQVPSMNAGVFLVVKLFSDQWSSS